MPVVSGINIDYINFLGSNYDEVKHIIFLNDKNKFDSIVQTDVIKLFPINFKNPLSLLHLIYNLFISNQIIVHSFFIYINVIYIIFPFLLSKSFLVLWGGDLYFYFNRTRNFKNKVIEFLRKIVLAKFINIITYINEDFNNFRKWYNPSAIQHNCIMYPSNVFSTEHKNFRDKILNHDKVNLMIGNSAIPENRHEFALKVIKDSLFVNATIYCPLSYGDRQYANKIYQLGVSYFGERFNSLFDYMDKEMYLKFLSKMDIILMLQERQAGMGNIIQLLGLGKKIYFDSNAPHFIYLRKIGFIVFSVNDFNSKELTIDEAIINLNLVKKYFSLGSLQDQWENIFNASSDKL
jgi:hypothetical protein